MDVATPAAAAGPDRLLCPGEPVLLDASASAFPGCPVPPLYEWSVGPLVVRPAAPDPTYIPPTGAVGSTTYTVAVTCPALPGCAASDDVIVRVASCTLAVRFDHYEAVSRERDVRISWSTLEENGTNFFVVERATAASGPFVALVPVADARVASTNAVRSAR